MNKTEDNEGFPGGREQVLLSLEKSQGTAGYDVFAPRRLLSAESDNEGFPA